MEISLKKIKTAASTLAQMDSRTYPAKMEYAFSVNRETFEKELKHLEEERVRLCKKHAEKDEDGKPVIKGNAYDMTPEASELCNKEYTELLDSTVDIPVRMIPLEVAERCEIVERYDTLTAGEMRALSFMFTD